MSVWSERRVCVTGGAGFLGSYVVAEFQRRGCRQVFVPRRRDYDLTDAGAVRRLYADARPHVVVHAAGVVGGIGANQAHPARFFHDNLMMGVQMLHEGWRAGVEKFVSIGTVCAYPKHTPAPFREDDLWNGYPEETNAPYGMAKKMLLVQGQAYRQEYGMHAIYLLPVNLYGPGDNFDPGSSHVIPALIQRCVDARLARQGQIVVWGDGSATREFLYARDAAEGIVLAAERYDEDGPVNLGSGSEISIRDLALLIARLTGFEGEVVWDASRPNGQPRRLVNIERARAAFGFVARTPFEVGLARTVAWYREHVSSSRTAGLPAPPGAGGSWAGPGRRGARGE
jgi:GDP-L-fucose synthase